MTFFCQVYFVSLKVGIKDVDQYSVSDGFHLHNVIKGYFLNETLLTNRKHLTALQMFLRSVDIGSFSTDVISNHVIKLYCP